MKALCAVVALVGWFVLPRVFGAEPDFNEKIYDDAVEGRAQIAAAVQAAGPANKRILVEIGGNTCSWCHRLHSFFSENTTVAARLKEDYVVVLLAINQRNGSLLSEYGDPYIQWGAPVIVILDANGRLLTTQGTGELEAGKSYDAGKVLAFLDRWRK
jgi:hypothetical protein